MKGREKWWHLPRRCHAWGVVFCFRCSFVFFFFIPSHPNLSPASPPQVITAIILPPFAVFFVTGLSTQLIINILLTMWVREGGKCFLFVWGARLSAAAHTTNPPSFPPPPPSSAWAGFLVSVTCQEMRAFV